jgi:hypothetical protein
LINEDFKIKWDDVYCGDGILIFDIDCEDGTELSVNNVDNRSHSKFYIMEKYFSHKKVVIDIDKFPDLLPHEVIDHSAYRFVTFRKTDIAGVSSIDVEKYIGQKLFSKFSAEVQNLIRSKIIDLYHDESW